VGWSLPAELVPVHAFRHQESATAESSKSKNLCITLSKADTSIVKGGKLPRAVPAVSLPFQFSLRKCKSHTPIDLKEIILGSIDDVPSGLAEDSDMRRETIFHSAAEIP
jgi:hypothetical protein